MEILQQQVQAQSREAEVLVIPCGSMDDARNGVEAVQAANPKLSDVRLTI